ncbi:MAG: glycoside hydrolase [Bryobacterales bacterium]|nr:glycoside hydrolase [Bryobacterales bacterium]
MGRFLLIFTLLSLQAQTLPPQAYQSLQWRGIGPFRAGRTVGATGIPTDPNTFYIGVNNGGVWKTTDAGRTWHPIFDQQPTGSIGDVAVAWSDPNVLYVGSGEGLQRPDLSTGDGIYKSTDAGKTWRNTGLRDAQQIGGLVVDPTDPDRVFVAALGHPYGPNPERGVYRTEDGGDTWQRVLFIDDNTGAIQVEFEPGNPNVIYAVLWAARQGARENDATQFSTSGLYKSTNGGRTWTHLTNGLPTTAQGLGRIGFGISPSQPKTIYATVEAPAALGGIYRSDDAGHSWRKVTADARTWGRGSDFAEIRVHPKNPETVYVGNIASYISTDGAKTFRAFKGAPGGDDYHRIWINPAHPEIMIFATDQGATITVNAGASWSSWYNQPTAQFYHVSTDNQWPYWVYGGQQESGSAGVASRGDYGAITWRDWRTVGVEEYGYVAPDPRDPNIIYGGKITRFDKRTGQVQNIAPEATRGRAGKYRFLRTAPVLFSPIDPRRLYYAGNVLFLTLTGGQSWSVISPEFSAKGVIYTVAPSHQDVNTIWAGTDDGTIHLTRDNGKTWQNVTPPGLVPWSKISLLESSHFDNNSAYAAVNTLRLDDLRPHIYRTHDAGKTWTEITTGIPANENVNAVREDPKRKGLLYAATERAVHFSLDDGATWQPLRQNMPATSIRDIVLHDDDLVAGTHGRGFWILDGVSVLRQIKTETTLYKPALATRVRRSANTDTPIPPEEPMGQNPPDGAIIDYTLAATTPVTLEILDATGRLVRKYASTDLPEKLDETRLAYPSYWFRPARILPAQPGHNRWIWDLRYAPPTGFPRSYPISAIYRDTPSGPEGPLALPGEYTIRLTTNGQTQTQKLTLRNDPRSPTQPTNHALRAYDLLPKAGPLARQLLSLMDTFDNTDAPPTTQALAALAALEAQLK